MVSTSPLVTSTRGLATRQTISDVATRLFAERGFDQVTVDDIAKAAGVGRMTVFKYFPRKDDMFFDLDEFGRVELLSALEQREATVTPVEALRQFVYRMVAERMPFVSFSGASVRFVETVRASEALAARARAIRDEIAVLLGKALADSVNRKATDLDAQLCATQVVALWSFAYIRAQDTYRKSQSTEKAEAVFLSLVDRGTLGLAAMMQGSPYGV